MPHTVTGACRCGDVRYTATLSGPPLIYACHCLDCQSWSGSAFSEQFFVLEASLNVEGQLAICELTSPSGRVSKQRVCARCSSRIYNTNSARPGIAVIRAGTLDDSDHIELVGHIWARRKQPWITIPDGIPHWPETPPPEDFMKMAGARVFGQ